MKLHYGIAAGTALGLLMATSQLGAATASSLRPDLALHSGTNLPLVLVQACPEDDPDCDPADDDGESDDTRPTAQEPLPGDQPPATQAPSDTIEAPRPPAQQPPAAIDGGSEPLPEPAPPAAIDGGSEPLPEPAPPAAIDGGSEPLPEPPAQAEPESPPGTIEAPRPPAEQPPAQQPPAAQPPAAQPPATPPGGAEPIPGETEPTPPAEQPPADQPPAQEPPVQRPPAQQPPAEQPPAQQPPAAQPPGSAEPVPGETEPAPPADQPPAAPPPAVQPPAQEPPVQRPPAQQPPAGEQPPAEQPPAQQPPAGAPEPVSGDQAPLLDSQKEDAPAGEPDAEAPDEAEAAPPPASDAEAQQFEEPVEVQSLREEEGRRVERGDTPRERREGSDVLREIGDRIVIQFNNQIVVESSDRERVSRDATEVYYEELPRGRTRETIVRPNGVQVITIRDRFGDIVRRSRIMPDGREYVLVYGDDRRAERRGGWVDPGDELPPLRLRIPAEEYILDARRAPNPQDYYEFFELPPVEPVRRLYTIDEVKYSARVRDSVRRVDLDTITFDFGSASISESEIMRLDGIASAMERLLEENPAETFLIEGHTDAVGSDEANLVLSDRRAESVAMALTNVFGIPPENLVTQGYGKRYLKIDTQAPERQNRRVAIRRITPLVSPVASN